MKIDKTVELLKKFDYYFKRQTCWLEFFDWVN